MVRLQDGAVRAEGKGQKHGEEVLLSFQEDTARGTYATRMIKS